MLRSRAAQASLGSRRNSAALRGVSKHEGHEPGRPSFETAASPPPQDEADRR
jgi:hypothetical protein